MTDPQIKLSSRFALEAEIGRGGMAVVYRGHDRHLDRPVAIKILRDDVSSALDVQRFQREIGLTAKLVHPGIVALFDSGEADGHLYYVMPFVPGDTLRARLDRDSRLSAHDVAIIGADVAEALAYAHGAGIVHRDIKPENVFLVEGRAVLADFGIARAVATHGRAGLATSVGMIVGTTTYMSPEQIEGADDLDGRTDLYSLGCVLYELLAGVPPFSGPSAMAVLAKHVTEMPKPLLERDADIAPALAALVMQLLAKSRDDRISSAAELAPLLRASTAIPSGETPRVVLAQKSPPANAVSDVDRLVDEARTIISQASVAGPNAVRRLEEARALLDRATDIDTSNARVLCARAQWHMISGHRVGNTEQMFAEGRRLLLAALAKDDRNIEVVVMLGKTALYHDDDFNGAEEYVRRIVELNDDDSEALRFVSIVTKILGEYDRAISASQQAVKIAPQHPQLWNGLGDALLAAGRNAEASVALKRAMSLKAAYGPALERLELAQLRLGDVQFASELRSSRLRVGGLDARADALDRNVEDVGPARARLLDVREELTTLLEEAERIDPFGEYFTTRTLSDRITFAYTELDDWSSALHWVERGYRNRPGRLRRALMDQLFDRRGFALLPGYGRLLRVAGLEELL